jgi:hypothetical protein
MGAVALDLEQLRILSTAVQMSFSILFTMAATDMVTRPDMGTILR